jgi:hypothetical protein
MAPSSNPATTDLHSTASNANRFGLHCVGIGDILDPGQRLVVEPG